MQILILEPADETFVDKRMKKSRIFGHSRFVVSSSLDGSIRVWNILTGIDECFTVSLFSSASILSTSSFCLSGLLVSDCHFVCK